jgi:sulfoxide reductase catalytic subunit YedY
MKTAKFGYIEPGQSEITPESLYISRRKFMTIAGAVVAGSALAACGVLPAGQITSTPLPAPPLAGGRAPSPTPITGMDETGAPFTVIEAVTHYNNFYEFSMDKDSVYSLAEKFNPLPWTIEVGGLVQKPKTFDMEEILKMFPSEERIYRLRCVEGWSMVIPWLGFPLSSLLKQVEPTGDAKFVRFTSVMRPEEMPGQNFKAFAWPYIEGLRLDEAMHPLTILSTGLYGKSLLNQNGAPIRLVVPWKYGFKSAKSIVKIELVSEQPISFWETSGPEEYGFYSNVNPNHPHPRWSQATERRLGELARRPTLMFNGYAAQVASLYNGMDLDKNY